jgi:hypothetical protein
MRRLLTMLILLAVLVPSIVQAKRKPPPKIEPVVYEGVRYVSPNDDGRRAYVQAWDTRTIKKLWEVTIFRNSINPFAEEDVQHVYIRKMSVRDGKLILVAEDDRAYSLDLNSRAVKKLKQVPPEPETQIAGGNPGWRIQFRHRGPRFLVRGARALALTGSKTFNETFNDFFNNRVCNGWLAC